MLKKEVVEYLMQNPDVIEKVKEGKASLTGLSEMEQQAVLDVFESLGRNTGSPLQFW
jgi:Bacillus competence pheromone ComX.